MEWKVLIGDVLDIERQLNKLEKENFITVHGVSVTEDFTVVVVSLQKEYKEFDKIE